MKDNEFLLHLAALADDSLVAARLRHVATKLGKIRNCAHCGNRVIDFYMVKDEVWPLAKRGGWLHIECLEFLVGFKVKAEHLKIVPGNATHFYFAQAWDMLDAAREADPELRSK